MNLKFFILGLFVLVSIAQVKTLPNGIEDAEANGKPNQFRLMELFSHKKRNVLSDLFDLKADKGEALDRDKRQESTSPAEEAAAEVEATLKKEEIPQGRRFNPLEAIGSLAQKPMQLALKQAMAKLAASYSDTSKPFGPTYDTTWGSPPKPSKSGRKMDTANQQSPEEIRMSTMIRPPADYYTYETHKQTKPKYYGTQSYYQSVENSAEPSLSSKDTYDRFRNNQQASFSSPSFRSTSSSYFTSNPYGQQAYGHKPFNRKDIENFHNLDKTFSPVSNYSPEQIEKLISERQKVIKSKAMEYDYPYNRYNPYNPYNSYNPYNTYNPYEQQAPEIEPSYPEGRRSNPYEQQAPKIRPIYPIGRRSNPTNLEIILNKAIEKSPELKDLIMGELPLVVYKILVKIKEKSPELVESLISEFKRLFQTEGESEISMRNGFMGDVYEKDSEEKTSGEGYSDTQVEFNGPQADVTVGNRRFAGNEDTQDSSDRLAELNNLALMIVELKELIETGTQEQVGERVKQLYKTLKDSNSNVNS